ncbi:nuclear transport factor 2 family protein [Neisseriaceae bacterium TC5R-5]|nr:nuclear transport factor 2 family protein [Neisseriaceae bacterium TC5R-5]
MQKLKLTSLILGTALGLLSINSFAEGKTSVPTQTIHKVKMAEKKASTVKITNLADLHVAWANYFNAKDIEGMLSIAEKGRIFIPAPGQVVQPKNVIKELGQFLELNIPVVLTVRHAYESGDIGLVVADWTMDGKAPDGTPVHIKGTVADVARRGADGGWKVVIDNPFGTAVSAE